MSSSLSPVAYTIDPAGTVPVRHVLEVGDDRSAASILFEIVATKDARLRVTYTWLETRPETLAV
jgi:hypothetical protein